MKLGNMKFSSTKFDSLKFDMNTLAKFDTVFSYAKLSLPE
jgi:hypothetical protein